MKERCKGKSLFSITDDYTVVDLETTGFSTQYNAIIEVGCIKFRGGKETERYQSLIRPSEPIPYIIECMTGIHNEHIQGAPTFDSVGMEIWDFLSNEIIVGHNLTFDINFLYDNFDRSFNLQFQNDFIDTLRFARLLLPNIREEGYNGYGLLELANYFDVPFYGNHRAIVDCETTNEIFSCLKELVLRDNIQLDELIRSRCNQRLTDLQSNGERFNPDHIFFNKNCVFTGKLERFTRVKAAQIVVDIGGHCENGITKQTNFLIVGDMDYKKGLEGYESSKLRKAKKLIADKQDLQILPESAFYDLIMEYCEDI